MQSESLLIKELSHRITFPRIFTVFSNYYSPHIVYGSGPTIWTLHYWKTLWTNSTIEKTYYKIYVWTLLLSNNKTAVMPPVAANERRLQLSVVLCDWRTSKVHPLSRVFTAVICSVVLSMSLCTTLCVMIILTVNHRGGILQTGHLKTLASTFCK